LHLLLPDRICETGKTGREVVEDGESGEPTRERITPLRELRVREPRKDLRDEEQRRHDREHRDYPQKELHAITDEQTKVAHYECEYASRE
jgi:hypothetical protein